MVTTSKGFKRSAEGKRMKLGRPIGSKSKRMLSEFIEFAPEDLIKIISTCKKNEVGSFSYGGLKIGFDKDLSQNVDIPTSTMNELNKVVGEEVFTDDQIEAQASEQHDQAMSMTEEELYQLQIVDPVKAQEILMGVGDA